MLPLGVGALTQAGWQGRGQLQCTRGAEAGRLPLRSVTCWVPRMIPKAEGEPVALLCVSLFIWFWILFV